LKIQIKAYLFQKHSSLGFVHPNYFLTLLELLFGNALWFLLQLDKNLDSDNFYCFKDIDNFILEGHYTYYLYSFFYIEFFPCVNFTLEYNEKTNTTIKVFNKNTCESLEKIDYYLKNTFVSLNMEDICYKSKKL
jgi:hypothetical protein